MIVKVIKTVLTYEDGTEATFTGVPYEQVEIKENKSMDEEQKVEQTVETPVENTEASEVAPTEEAGSVEV